MVDEKKLKKGKKTAIKEWLIENALILVIFLMVIYSAFFADNFVSFQNLKNVMMNVSVRFIIALGVSGCLITKGTDLSAGRIVGLTSVVTALMLQRPDASSGVIYPALAGKPILVAMLAALLVGMFFGMINGGVVSFFYVPPFIATLGTQIAIYGLNMMLSQNKPVGSLNNSFTTFGVTGLQIGPLIIPWIFFVSLLVVLIMNTLYRHTVYGKNMYAIGGNEVAAEVSGVNTKKSNS